MSTEQRILAKIKWLEGVAQTPGIIGDDAFWRANALRRQLDDLKDQRNNKERWGRCDACGEMTPVDDSCCGKGVWFEGSKEFEDDGHSEDCELKKLLDK